MPDSIEERIAKAPDRVALCRLGDEVMRSGDRIPVEERRRLYSLIYARQDEVRGIARHRRAAFPATPP